MKEEDKEIAFFIESVVSGGVLYNLEVEALRGCHPGIYKSPVRLEPVCYEFKAAQTYVDASSVELAKPAGVVPGYRVLRVIFPLADEVRWVETEEALSTLSGHDGTLSFEIMWDGSEIKFYLAVPSNIPTQVIRGVFERIDREIIVMEQNTDHLEALKSEGNASLFEICVEPPYYTELFDYKNRVYSPLTSVQRSMARTGANSSVVLQIIFERVRGDWKKNIKAALDAEHLLKRKSAGSATLSKELKDFTSKPLFAVRPRMYGNSCSSALGECVNALIGDFQHGGKNVFFKDTSDFKREAPGSDVTNMVKSRVSHMTGIILNSAELSGFVHLPDKSVMDLGLPIKHLDSFKVPQRLLEEGVPVGTASLYGTVHVPTTGMSMNIYMIGRSGSGKSESLKHQLEYHVKEGHGVALFDPHGRFAEEVLRLASLRDRLDDVCFINPCDDEYVLDYNPFDIDDISDAGRLASDYVNSTKILYSASSGYRMNHILGMSYNALFVTGNNMNSMPKLWSISGEGEHLRREVINKTTNSEVKRFFEDEIMTYKMEALLPIISRVSTLLTDDRTQRIFSRTKSKVNLSKMMNEGKILIVSLPVGLLGAEISSQLGSMMLAQLQKAAFHRKEGCKPFFIFADECYRFEGALGIYESFLNETRKFGVYLNLSHQTTGQISDDVLKSFLSASNIMSFGVNIDDAKLLSRTFDNRVKPEELVGLNVGEVVSRIDNAIVRFKTFPPGNLKYSETVSDQIVKHSREKYYTKLSDVKKEPEKKERFYDSF